MRLHRGPGSNDLVVRLLVGAAWIAAFAVLASLVGLVRSHPIPFDTDEADHANAGLQLYRSLSLGPAPFFEAVTRQAFYPPINSFVVAATYLVLGPGILESRLCSILQFALYLLALFILVSRDLRQPQYGPPNPLLVWTAASFALLASASSPVIFLNALLIMLEPTGILLVTLLLLLLGRERLQPISTGILLALIMLTKYSFGIVVAPALVCAIFLEPEARLRERVRRAGSVALVFLGLMAVWILVTDRHAMWHFFLGHPSYVPFLSIENLTFDIRAWLLEYTIHPSISVLFVLLSAFALRKRWRSLVPRTAFLIIVFALIILTISTTNELRHLMVIVPAAFYLGALGLYDLLSRVRLSRPKLAESGAAALVLTLVFGCYSLVTTIGPRAVAYFEGEPEYLALQEFIVAHADATEPILIAGTTDDFSLESIRYLAALHTGLGYTDVRIDSFPFSRKRSREDGRRKRNVASPFAYGSTPNDVEAVLDCGYYRSAVQVEDLSGTLEDSVEDTPILTALHDRPSEEMTRHGVRVVVYLLPHPATLATAGPQH